MVRSAHGHAVGHRRIRCRNEKRVRVANLLLRPTTPRTSPMCLIEFGFVSTVTTGRNRNTSRRCDPALAPFAPRRRRPLRTHRATPRSSTLPGPPHPLSSLLAPGAPRVARTTDAREATRAIPRTGTRNERRKGAGGANRWVGKRRLRAATGRGKRSGCRRAALERIGRWEDTGGMGKRRQRPQGAREFGKKARNSRATKSVGDGVRDRGAPKMWRATSGNKRGAGGRGGKRTPRGGRPLHAHCSTRSVLSSSRLACLEARSSSSVVGSARSRMQRPNGQMT